MSESIKYIDISIEIFKRKRTVNKLIDSLLLACRIKFPNIEEKTISDFEHEYFAKCNNDQKTEFLIIKDIYNNIDAGLIIKRLNTISSTHVKFKMAAFFTQQSISADGIKILKKVAVQLSKQKNNYFYYEYNYIYFSCFYNTDKINNTDKNLFLEVYYYFLKNERIASNNIVKIKRAFEENNILKDLLDNARTVDGYKGWKTPW